MHVHIEVDDHGHNALPSPLVEAASKYFKTSGPRPDLNAIADMYRERKIAAGVFTVDASSHRAHPPNSSEDIAVGAAENNDVLIPFGSEAVTRAVRLAADFGVHGFKFHPSVVATHKKNVWIDLSGWSPKYFPQTLVPQASSLLQDKMLFGSDFPLITPGRWMKDFALLDLHDEVRHKIVKANAVRRLGL